MTQIEIISMAQIAGFYFQDAGYAPILHTTKDEYSERCFERFANLVAKAEREACAKICEEQSENLGGIAEGPFVTDFGKHTHMSMAAGASNCAAALRAMGTHSPKPSEIQAAYEKGLEDAMRVCNPGFIGEYPQGSGKDDRYDLAKADCVEAIRKLKTSPTQATLAI